MRLPLPRATSRAREVLKTRLARDLPLWQLLRRRAIAKRDVISHTASADDLYVCKVTFTMLKTVFAGYKQLLTFLHLL